MGATCSFGIALIDWDLNTEIGKWRISSGVRLDPLTSRYFEQLSGCTVSEAARWARQQGVDAGQAPERGVRT